MSLQPFRSAWRCLFIGAAVIACLNVAAQTAPVAKEKPAPAKPSTRPARMLTVELRVGSDEVDASDGQRWGSRPAADEEWQKLSVAQGEKARFEFGSAQAWTWVHTVMRGNGAGSADGVGQSLQWSQDLRALECQVQWTGGSQPARVEVSVKIAEGGKGLVDGVLPKQRSSNVQTVVWAPLGQWVTLARSGPRPAAVTEGSYSSRNAEVSEARVLQLRILAPD